MTREAGQVLPASIEREEPIAEKATHVARDFSQRPLLGFIITYLLTVGSLITVGILWQKPGFDMLVVGMGWPHVLLGLAFNLNRVGRADRKAHLFFVSLLLITLVIAVGHRIVSITSLIYLYFVFHAIRDEIYIYRQRSSGFSFRGRIFDRNGRAVLIAGAIIALVGQSMPRDPELQLKWYYLQLTIAAILAVLALVKRPRRLFEKWPGFTEHASHIPFCDRGHDGHERSEG
jgi:predicted membrane channel-forming protein YqfA (hemolysin III family)